VLRLLLGLLALLVTAGPAAAQALKDVAGGRDHPAIKRYEGSILLAIEEKAFDEQLLALGPYLTGPDGKDAFTDSRTVEGKRSRRLYMAPDGRSSLEVFRNYEKALAEAGFTTLFSGAKEACGRRDGLLG
jgi:OOP family OmpA-OmpF porin